LSGIKHLAVISLEPQNLDINLMIEVNSDYNTSLSKQWDKPGLVAPKYELVSAVIFLPYQRLLNSD